MSKASLQHSADSYFNVEIKHKRSCEILRILISTLKRTAKRGCNKLRILISTLKCTTKRGCNILWIIISALKETSAIVCKQPQCRYSNLPLK